MTGFYMKCNTGLKWVNKSFFYPVLLLPFLCRTRRMERLKEENMDGFTNQKKEKKASEKNTHDIFQSNETEVCSSKEIYNQ